MDTVDIPSRLGHVIRCNNASLKCPFCGQFIIPSYLFAEVNKDGSYDVMTKCVNSACGKIFITNFRGSDFINIVSTAPLEKRSFSDIITGISKDFQEIYNQAYAAEQMKLNHVCGVGYRKALEFLIKDYLKANLPEEEHRKIENKSLGKCIEEDITDNNIKVVSKRAVWLGNDETHYVRKWEDKDVHDLKSLIGLTLRWIESEIETKNLISEMPESKKNTNTLDK